MNARKTGAQLSRPAVEKRQKKKRIRALPYPLSLSHNVVLRTSRQNPPCGIIRAMRIEAQQATATRQPASAHLAPSDVELTIKAVRGIADVEAGRCAPVADVRARILSRYEPSRVCV